MEACRASGCVVCNDLGFARADHGGPIEYHHLLSGGLRIGHRFGFAACKWHHQGSARPGRTVEQMIEKYGTNLRDDRSGFHAQFGSDQSLLNGQDDRIGCPREQIPTRRELRERVGASVKRKPSRTARPSKMLQRNGLV